MMLPTGPIDAPRWSAYIAVDTIEECATKVQGLGGEIVVPPHNISDIGQVCTITDLMGAAICLI